jgi:hypothetical protein
MAVFEAETSPDCAGVAGEVAASVLAADTVTGLEGGGGGSGSCLSADLDTAFIPCDPSLGAGGETGSSLIFLSDAGGAMSGGAGTCCEGLSARAAGALGSSVGGAGTGGRGGGGGRSSGEVGD